MTAQGLASVLREHWPHPVFGCECTPTDEESGVKETLDVSWEVHVADLVMRWLETVAGDAAVRESVADALDHLPITDDPYSREQTVKTATAAVAALLAAVRSR